MLKQRLDDKFHIVEVLKWGIFDGALVGGFVALLTIVHAKRDQIISLAGAGSWEFGASLFLILLVSISAIVTSTLTFAHPIYSLMHGSKTLSYEVTMECYMPKVGYKVPI